MTCSGGSSSRACRWGRVGVVVAAERLVVRRQLRSVALEHDPVDAVEHSDRVVIVEGRLEGWSERVERGAARGGVIGHELTQAGVERRADLGALFGEGAQASREILGGSH